MFLSSLGFIAGLWAEKFDNMAAVTNFVVVPLSFLSGTFFSINRLEGPLYTMSQFNPFFILSMVLDLVFLDSRMPMFIMD